MSTFIYLIAWSYYLLVFLVPLVLYPHTSEIFEFNKLLITYLLTTVVSLLWIIRMIVNKKAIFRRTKLDIPILIFLAAITISTLFSLDIHTSIYGYYSRFHGGLLSYLTYAILYWAFVSNLNRSHAVKTIHSIVISSILVCIYAVLQHFGIDKELWVQDVQTRVFSTLGQPNWLAAWLTALIPLSWVFIHARNFSKNFDIDEVFLGNYWVSLFFTFLYFIVLSYTQSRSGYIALAVSGLIYALAVLYFTRKNRALLFKKAAIPAVVFLIYSLLSGTPFTPSVMNILSTDNTASTNQVSLNTQQSDAESQQNPQGNTAPKVSFSSKEIRYIVWEGAFDVWKNNAILGTGPETFAYSYYKHRPEEHNLVSEWDFLYNKAHNEYLNQLATTGLVGTLAYLIYHGGVFYLLLVNFKNDETDDEYIHIALASGFVAIMITNFIGFSVVPVALLMFLFPALSVALMNTEDEEKGNKLKITRDQKIYISVAAIVALFIAYRIINYWRADMLYAKGVQYNDVQSYQTSSKLLDQAIQLRGNESVYWQELSEAQGGLALLLYDLDEDLSKRMAQNAYNSSEKAESMNPYDVNNIRKQASVYIKLSYIDGSYLQAAEETITRAVELAPTEAKLIYNLGAVKLQKGEVEEAMKYLDTAIDMRPVYIDARYAKALALIELDREEEAREQLNFILENLDSDEHRTLKALQTLDNKQ